MSLYNRVNWFIDLLFDPTGRASRREWWLGMVAISAVVVLLTIVCMLSALEAFTEQNAALDETCWLSTVSQAG